VVEYCRHGADGDVRNGSVRSGIAGGAEYSGFGYGLVRWCRLGGLE